LIKYGKRSLNSKLHNGDTPLDSDQGDQSEYHFCCIPFGPDDDTKMQQILIILMLLALVGSFLLLAGLVFFSEGIVQSHPES
jgi:hypothetical protein